ncbi:MBOAT family O-acyltransferase [Roseibium sp. M-1]
MVFSSAFFILAFLPIFLVLYFLTPFRYKSAIILAGSYFFYAWWRVDYLALLILVTIWSYFVGHRIHSSQLQGDARAAQRYCTIGVAGNLSVLLYFKYFNFFVDSVSLTFFAGEPLSPLFGQVILPIGISFYVFQAISYVVDVARKDAPPATNLFDFAAFIALFPQLIAGPVLRYKDLADQFVEREHSWEKFGEGSRMFMLGLAKKVLIADSVAPIADTMFGLDAPTLSESWLGITAYTIQLYFDFSGYSDMAIGLGLMLGFHFIRNFHFPYISRSITEFWRRWHLSLSAWLRDYLYIPLGGNRVGFARTYVNLFLTMFLGGLWHGANWTFAIWGAWHGLLLGIERYFGVSSTRNRSIVYLPMTLVFVMIGWVFFRAENVHSAFAMLSGMAGMNGFGMTDIVAWQITRFSLAMLAVSIVIVYLEPYLSQFGSKPAKGDTFVSPEFISVRQGLLVSSLGVLSLVKLTADNDSPFLYFQF